MENNKINIVELLKDCPTGMPLNCTQYEHIEFDYIDNDPEAIYPIRCLMKTDRGLESAIFTRFGCSDKHPNAKCVIFPKNKTTWKGFISPNKFKDGDILYIDCTEDNNIYPHNKYIFILKEIKDNKIYCYCHIDEITNYKGFNISWLSDTIYPLRFATKKEKEKLFQAIKDNGYKWNEETKTLEMLVKPKFKIGDKIRKIENPNEEYTISDIFRTSYKCRITTNRNLFISIKSQDDWELISDKFDISTLIIFESKVLVRDFENQIWKPAIYGGYISDFIYPYYVTIGGRSYKQLIPYKGNEHLCNKSNDCSKYYKTWEK